MIQTDRQQRKKTRQTHRLRGKEAANGEEERREEKKKNIIRKRIFQTQHRYNLMKRNKETAKETQAS